MESKEQKESDMLILLGLMSFFGNLRDGAKKISSKWAERDLSNFTRSKQARLFKEVESLMPDLSKADKFVKDRIIQEYGTAYYRAGFFTVQESRDLGYDFIIKKYRSKSYIDAIFSPLRKNEQSIIADRNVTINRIYSTIKNGLISGEPLQKINRKIDILLGYRDKRGKLISRPSNYKGEAYRRLRVLRTEVGRIRSQAETEEWLSEKSQGIDRKLVYSAVLDDRTRSQSGGMDGQVARADGKFRYPNGNYYFQGSTGNPAWDVNDRCTTIKTDPEFPPSMRIKRGEDGKTVIIKYKTFREYAKDQGLTVNKYGQAYFKEDFNAVV